MFFLPFWLQFTFRAFSFSWSIKRTHPALYETSRDVFGPLPSSWLSPWGLHTTLKGFESILFLVFYARELSWCLDRIDQYCLPSINQLNLNLKKRNIHQERKCWRPEGGVPTGKLTFLSVAIAEWFYQYTFLIICYAYPTRSEYSMKTLWMVSFLHIGYFMNTITLASLTVFKWSNSSLLCAHMQVSNHQRSPNDSHSQKSCLRMIILDILINFLNLDLLTSWLHAAHVFSIICL